MIMNIFPSFKNRVDTPSRVKSFSTEKRKFVFYRPKIKKKKKIQITEVIIRLKGSS